MSATKKTKRQSSGPALRLPTLEEVRKALAYQSFTYFMDYDSGFRDTPGKHLDVLDRALQDVSEGKIRRLIVTMPPRHGKSERVSKKFPAWHLGRNPDDEIILASYSIDLARDHSRIARSTLENRQDVFGITLDPDRKSAESWGVAGHRGGVVAAGVGGPITGRGAKIAIVDDPVKNAEEANSEVIREKIWEWYQSTLYTRLTPDGRIIIVMTRWHEDDLVGRLLKKEREEIADGTHRGERWTVINFPAIAEENDVLGRKPGEPLWPEFGFDLERLNKIKQDVGSYVFNALYQQRPSAQEGNILKREWWRYYEVLPPVATMIISVDAAFKDEDDSDFVVVQVWGKNGPNCYLIDQARGRMNFPATIQTIRNMCKKYPKAALKLIEDKANGSAIIQTLQHEIPGIVAVNPEGGKVSRVNAVSPFIEAGNVYLPRTSWIHDFVEECAAFPNGAHDDQVDAMSQALMRFYYFSGKFPEPPKHPTVEERIVQHIERLEKSKKRKRSEYVG